MSDIKRYIPKASSLGTSQVLPKPYSPENARLIAWEMTDELILDLARKRLVTDEVAITIGYERTQPQGFPGTCHHQAAVMARLVLLDGPMPDSLSWQA